MRMEDVIQPTHPNSKPHSHLARMGRNRHSKIWERQLRPTLLNRSATLRKQP